MSLTDASMRSFFEGEDSFQNKGSVVDMLLDFSLRHASGHKISFSAKSKSVCLCSVEPLLGQGLFLVDDNIHG